MTIDEFLKEFRKAVREARNLGYELINCDGNDFAKGHIRLINANNGSYSCPVLALAKGYGAGSTNFLSAGAKIGLSKEDTEAIVYSADNCKNQKGFSARLRHRLLDAKRDPSHRRKPAAKAKAVDVIA